MSDTLHTFWLWLRSFFRKRQPTEMHVFLDERGRAWMRYKDLDAHWTMHR